MVSTILLMTALAHVATSSDLGTPESPKPHPRLLVSGAEEWNTLRARRDTDPSFDALWICLEREAAFLQNLPLPARKMEGRRLLTVSRQVLKEVMLFSFLHNTSGDPRYADRAEAVMRAAASFPDWNPDHFLDVAEMTTALAIGYDWLHHRLSEETRRLVRRAIVEKGLKPGLDPADKRNWWINHPNNWNQVCHAGLTLGALAVMEDEPVLARQILDSARNNISHGLEPYKPDGVYPEGPLYWVYGSSYQILLIAALRSALGTDWGLSENQPFKNSGAFMAHMTGPSLRFFNFADGDESAAPEAALYWMAREYKQPAWLILQKRLLDLRVTRQPKNNPQHRFLPLLALWMPASAESATDAGAEPDTSWIGHGPSSVAAHRSSWNDPDAFYIGLKGGMADISHGQMDAGTFVLDAFGVRWATDLDKQDYNSIESAGWNLWDRAQNSDRWKIFRLNNRSHNTLTLDGALHKVDGFAPIIQHRGGPDRPHTVVDLTAVFDGRAARAQRGCRMESPQRIRLQDELDGLAPGLNVRWNMVTRTTVTVVNRTAQLRSHDKTLLATLVEPAGAKWKVLPCDPPDDGVNHPNPNTWMLTLDIPAPAQGTLRIVVDFHSEKEQDTAGTRVEPLVSWSDLLPNPP